MNSKRKKILKVVIAMALLGALIGGGTMYYMMNMPHRNAQNAATDFQLTALELTNAYLTNAAQADEKFLSDDGDSRVLEVSGTVYRVSEDFNGRTVVILKEENAAVGVSCTFLDENGHTAKELQAGQTVVVKGVIRSGASYDADFDMYSHAVLEQCALVE